MDHARGKGDKAYRQILEPHVKTAGEIWVVVKPKLAKAEKQAEGLWTNAVVPGYRRVSPYMMKAYQQGKYLIVFLVKEGGEKAVDWGRGIWSEVIHHQINRLHDRFGGLGGNRYVFIFCDVGWS